jgi:hypothetical protein
MRVVQQIRQFVLRVGGLPPAELAALAVWTGMLVLVELAGRKVSVNDLTDALLLGFLVSFTLAVHSVRPLPPVRWLVRRMGRMLLGLWHPRFEIGVDLRGTPPVKRGSPPIWARSVGVLAALTLVLTLAAPVLPTAFREWLLPCCFLAYLLVIGVIWIAAALTAVLLAFLGWAMIHDWFVMSYQGQGVRPKRPERLTVLAVAGILVLAAAWLPIWIPAVVTGLALVVVSVGMACSGPGLTLLWRHSAGEGVRSVDGRWFLWLHWALLIFLTTTLLLPCTGELLVGTGDESAATMPLTVLIGRVLGWAAVPGLGVAAWHSLRFAGMGMRFNPYRDAGAYASMSRGVPFPSQAKGNDREWEIGQRRALVRGLKRLFKRAARVSRGKGTGLWIGLHHWFIPGLTRDASENDDEKSVLDEIIGPPYHRVFSPETRLHFWQICRALEVDLILVEDGVTFRRFIRVLRMMFEVYDMFGGRQRAEELHFTGLPGVRVVIHEFGMGTSESHGREGYPEPDYNEIGRGRILHVFKDRGEEEEFDSIPTDSEGVPVFSGV